MRSMTCLVLLLISLCGSCSSLFASALADDLVGTWTYSNPAANETITLVFNADGTGTIDGDAVRYVRRGNQLAVTVDGEQITYAIAIDGNQMIASGGDLEGRLAFVRQDAANSDAAQDKAPHDDKQPDDARTADQQSPMDPKSADAPAASPIVGTWTDGNGQIVFNADGSCDYVGQKMKYEYDGAVLKLHGPTGDVEMQVKIEGDAFTATVGKEVQQLSRVKTGEQKTGAAGVAGVYMYSEASVDPTNVMCITQYLTLYPDGTIGWFKTELGASRTQVTDCLERFASFKTNPQAKGRTYGTWRADEQGNVQLQWNIWNNLQCNGRLDPASGKLTVEKMGILDEGATLSYDRQQ